MLIPTTVAQLAQEEMTVNIEEIIEALKIEKDRLTRVIYILRPKGERGVRKGRRLSVTARKRISEGMRRNWASRKERAKE